MESVSAHVHIRRDTPLPQYAPLQILDETNVLPQLRRYLMDGLFLNQKTNKSIRISYSLKYKHWKKIIYEKINVTVEKNKHSGEQYLSNSK